MKDPEHFAGMDRYGGKTGGCCSFYVSGSLMTTYHESTHQLFQDRNE